MAIKKLKDLFVHHLKDMYYAENKISKELSKLVKMASSQKLKKEFKTHQGETGNQIKRLNQAFKALRMKPAGVRCQAIDGIINESQHILNECSNKKTRDAALVACAQAVEHYELTRYGTLITFAEQLGYKDVVSLLRENMQEEANANRNLTVIALDTVNPNAA